HRRKTRFGTVSDQDEYERQLHNARIQSARNGDQRSPTETNLTLLGNGSVVHENRSHKSECDSDRGQDQVLVCRLKSGAVLMKVYQEYGRERRAFDRHPHHAEIVRCYGEKHREDEKLEQGIEQSHSREMCLIELQPHVSDS